MKPMREIEAKEIVVEAFRNGPLEKIHAEGRISDEEIKELMKFAVDKVNYILWLKEEKPQQYLGWYHLVKMFFFTEDNWDGPRDPEKMHEEYKKAMMGSLF